MTNAKTKIRSFLDREVSIPTFKMKSSSSKVKALGLSALGVALVGSITGFTLDAGASAAAAKEHAVVLDAKNVSLQFQTWTAAQDGETAVPANANSVAVANGNAVEAVSSVVTSDGVFWSISGTADSYCVKAYNEKGGTYTATKPFQFASPGSSRESACTMQATQDISDADAPIDNSDATITASAKPKS